MITSNQNQLIKEIQLLQRKKKERMNKQLFIIEGLRAVEEIPSSWNVDKYVVAESYMTNDHHITNHSNAPVYYVADSIFKNITNTQTPQGIMAIVSYPQYNLEDIIFSEQGFFIIGDEIQDPGNLGTLIRTAHAAGVNGVFLSKGCVDIYNPKTVRATMGSIFHIPIFVDIEIEELIPQLVKSETNVYATAIDSNKTIYDCDYTTKTAIVIGNEANGIRKEIKDMINNYITIPMPGGSESLNASIAAGICMYEVVRQRNT